MFQHDNSQQRMPVMFVGHGNPMNALTEGLFAKGWMEMVRDLPRPEAILCVSAHWDTRGIRVNTTSGPETIHDFWGFPRELYEVNYPCPGSPRWARETAGGITATVVQEDAGRGLDHGVWSVLKWMYPKADVPVFQMSLDTSLPAHFHYELGRQLSHLREKKILLVGSGNMVHNLAVIDMTEGALPYSWAAELDDLFKQLIVRYEHGKLIDYENLHHSVRLAIPTSEHYLPLLTILGTLDPEEPIEFYNEAIDLRSVSMTSFRAG